MWDMYRTTRQKSRHYSHTMQTLTFIYILTLFSESEINMPVDPMNERIRDELVDYYDRYEDVINERNKPIKS